MNLEFHATGKSTMKGLMGISTKTENARVSQSDGNEKSAQFKDLLNQSKQDIKQADRQLESTRENRKDLETSQTSDDQKAAVKEQLKDNTGKVEDDQPSETNPKELQNDQNQVDSALLTVENAQLLGVQSLQGGVNEVLTDLNFKLGLTENEVPESIVSQVQSGQPVQMEGLSTEIFGAEEVPLFNGTQTDQIQTVGPNVQMVASEQNPEIKIMPGTISKAQPESKVLTTEGNGAAAEIQVNTNTELMGPNADVQNQQTTSDDVNAKNGKSQKLMDATPGLNTAATFTVEPTTIDAGEENTVLPAENQSLGEKGVQEISASSINTTKGAEVQTNNTPVVHQVEQKILQNFEPNKPMVLQMTLSPENLGDIEVKLKFDQGKLVIDITAASRETQNLLGKQINQLVRGLALQNVQVETVHINTPVEASSTGGNTSSLMNSGSDFSQQQNNTQLRESFLRNSSIQNSLLGNGNESDDEGIISIAQNLQYNGQRRINYYV